METPTKVGPADAFAAVRAAPVDPAQVPTIEPGVTVAFGRLRAVVLSGPWQGNWLLAYASGVQGRLDVNSLFDDEDRMLTKIYPDGHPRELRLRDVGHDDAFGNRRRRT